MFNNQVVSSLGAPLPVLYHFLRCRELGMAIQIRNLPKLLDLERFGLSRFFFVFTQLLLIILCKVNERLMIAPQALEIGEKLL